MSTPSSSAASNDSSVFPRTTACAPRCPTRLVIPDPLPVVTSVTSRDTRSRRAAARDDEHGPGPHDLAALDRERDVREGERAADALHARARLDPVARAGRAQEVDCERDGGPVLVVVGPRADRATE